MGSEEWTTELAQDCDLEEFQDYLGEFHIKTLASGKVNGVQKLLCCGQQVLNFSIEMISV